MRRLFCALIALSGCVLAQTDEQPRFEIASIKLSARMRGGFFQILPGARVSIIGMTLKDMIVQAWSIQPYQISGGPPWLDSVRYDVSAIPADGPKAGSNVAEVKRAVVQMLQSLLADRFQLTIHRETRELPVYALVVAKKDGKLGPRLIASKEDSCAPPDPSIPPLAFDPGKLPPLSCGSLMVVQSRRWKGASITPAQLCPLFARIVERAVVDKTGLTGKYDLDMEWAPDEVRLTPPPLNTLEPPAFRPARSFPLHGYPRTTRSET
jgi:uncharacterized protein (TIGR03435 family)